MILVVEDDIRHFDLLRHFLRELYPDEREISREQSREDAERVIAACREQSIPLILIIDLLMEVTGGVDSLTDYVVELWEQTSDKWLARVPIVVWSRYAAGLRHLSRRRKSAVVDQLESTGMADLEDLTAALQQAMS